MLGCTIPFWRKSFLTKRNGNSDRMIQLIKHFGAKFSQVMPRTSTLASPMRPKMNTGGATESESIHPPICLSVSVSTDLSSYLSVSLSICLSISPCIYLSVCLAIFLSVYRSAYVSIYLSVYLSIYLSQRAISGIVLSRRRPSVFAFSASEAPYVKERKPRIEQQRNTFTL